MPFKSLGDDDIVGIGPAQQEFLETPLDVTPEQPEKKPGFREVVGANIQLHNPIANIVANAQLPSDDTIDEGFNPSAHLKGTPWEADPSVVKQALGTVNKTQFDNVIARAQRETEYRNITSKGDLTDNLVGGMVAGMLDPTVFIPVTSIYRATKVGTAVATVGAGVASGGIAIGAQEAALQATQITRTAEESRNAILAGSAISGILGGIPAAFRARNYQSAVEYMNSTLSNDFRNLEGSVGAAKATPVDPEATKIAKFGIIPEALAKKYPKLTESINNTIPKLLQVPGFRSPMTMWQTSKFDTVRSTALGTFDHILEVKGHKQGVAFRPMERELFVREAKVRNAESDVIDTYTKYVNRIRKEGGSPLKMSEYQSELTRAATENGQHAIPEVQAAYKRMKQELDEANKLLHEHGFYDDDQLRLTLEGDTHRAWDRSAVLADRTRLRDIIADAHIAQRQNIRARLNKELVAAPEASRAKIRKQLDEAPELDRAEALSISDGQIDSVLGLGESTTELMNLYRRSETTGAGFVKNRTIPVRNKDVSDFLVQNFSDVSTLYLRHAHRMVEFKKAMQRLGWEDVNDPLKALAEEYNSKQLALRQDIKDKKRLDKELGKLSKEYAAAQEDVKDMLSVALGQYHVRTKADAALKMLRTYQFVRLMDQIVLASLPDVFTDAMRHGLSRTATGWQNMFKDAIYPQVRQMHTKDVMALGHSLDAEINGVLNRIVDPEAEGGIKSGVEKWTDFAGNAVSTLYGAKHWNKLNRRMGRLISAHRIVDEIRTLKKYPKAEVLTKKQLKEVQEAETYLNEHGLGTREREIIFKNWSKATDGADSGSTQVLNAENWSEQAKDIMIQAVERDARFSVLTPGKGDIPLVIQKYSLAQALLQFKGFATTANSRILLAGLQKSDANTLMGATALVGMGAMSYIIRSEIDRRMRGKEGPDFDESNLIKEGFYRSGVGGLFADTVQLFTPGQYSTRLQNTNRVEYWLGPSYSSAKILSAMWGDAVSGKLDEKTADQAIRLLPASRILQMIKLFNEID